MELWAKDRFPCLLLAFPFVVGLTVVLANTPGNTSSLQVGPPGIQVLLYLQGQEAKCTQEWESQHRGSWVHPNSGWSEQGKAQSQGLGERPHFTGQEEAIHETGALSKWG